MSFPKYPKYKPSGAEWLGDVPEHWEVRRLKRFATATPSNVDKKSHDGEQPVQLCNYVDVYYNDEITSSLEFMTATASDDQISKFTLRRGDTIITKDSETADDIAIAAHVPEDLPGVVCGYHLSVIRPQPGTVGKFIKWLFGSRFAKSCFAVRANGLTRVGLAQHDLENVEFPYPPTAEQRVIAAFLDRETAKIDALIAEQERLIELLKEKRQAVVSHAVTKGLDPAAPIKKTGFAWLGAIPEHWQVCALRHLVDCLDSLRVPLNAEERALRRGSIPYWGANSIVDYVATALVSEPVVLLGEDGAPFFDKPKPVAFYVTVPIWPNNHVHVLRPHPRVLGSFLAAVLNVTEYDWFVDGATRGKLTQSAMKSIPVPLPGVEEQTRIVEVLDRDLRAIDALVAEAEVATDLLAERRAALISAAVTGQIDVRHAI
jgi:type I restriction enzyme S subunit